MPQGLQVFDPQGRLVFDTNDYAGKVLGTFVIPAQSSFSGPYSGTIVDSRFLLGRPWFYYAGTTLSSNYGSDIPTIRVSGDTLTWSFTKSPYIGNTTVSFGGRKLVYGIY